MTTDWLQIYLVDAVKRNLCTQIHCTTCGAMEFRLGLLKAVASATNQQPRQRYDNSSAIEIAKELAKVKPVDDLYSPFEDAVRCILFDLCSGIPLFDKDIKELLAGSWAGDLLQSMTIHHKTRLAARRTREEYESPDSINKRREEKKLLKQELHQKRLALKKERDKLWHEQHGEIDRTMPQ